MLYGDVGSGSATTELTLAEIGAPVEIRDVSLDKEAQRGDDYRSVNAQRKLPTLLTADGEVLTESSAILLTLNERHPDCGLLPAADHPGRAQGIRWLMFVATELYPLIEIIDYPERFQPEGQSMTNDRRESIREHVRTLWKQRWSIVERSVSGDGWFLGSGFSLLDIYVAVVSRWGQLGEWRPDHLPQIEAIAAGVASRPRCQAVWARHFG